MATASYVRGNFLGGEWSKLAQGRYDLQTYPTALNVCLNMLPLESGALVRRPGTRFITYTLGGHQGRLIPFAFQQNMPYVLEFTAGALRFIAASGQTSGFSVVDTNDSQNVTAISAASPAQVTTQNAHGWSSGDKVRFRSVPTSAAVLQNRGFQITVTGASTFTLIDELDGTNIDGSTIGAIGGLIVDRVLVLIPPYTTNQLTSIRKVQAEKTAVFLCPGVFPQTISVVTEPTVANFATFSGISAVPFVDGPYLDQYLGTSLTPSGLSGSITLTSVLFGENTFPGFVLADVGRLVRLFSQPPGWDGGTTYPAGAVVAFYTDPGHFPTLATYYQAISITTGASPPLNPDIWTLVTGTSVAIWTWATITLVNSASNVTVTIDGNPLLYTSVIYAWRLGVYTPSGATVPICGVYHEGRLGLFGAIGNRFDLSVSNDIFNFAPTAPDGSVGAANAITGVCNAEDVNPILWAQSHQQGIIAGTQPAEWLIFAPTAGAMAPNNIAAHRVTKIGGASLEAVAGEHTIIFVQRFGRRIMEYFADVFSGKFSAPVVNWLSKHLTRGGIQEIAYQQELVPTLWARVSNTLVGWVYKRESLVSANPPTFAAGHRHVFGSGRTVESIAVGPSVDGTTDSLMLITNDPLLNLRWVEILSDVPDEGATLLEAQYVDCALSPAFVLTAPTNDAPYGGIQLLGLWPHDGKTVSAWIGGLDCGDFEVIDGKFTVPFGDGVSAGTGNGLLTQSYLQSIPGVPIWVGYTYTSDGQIVRPNSPQETGARNGPGFMKLRRTNWFGLQLEGVVTGSISFGTEFDSLQAIAFSHPGARSPTKAYTVLEQFTGIFRDSGKDSNSFDSMICWRVTRPYPCNVAAVGGALETTDI